MLLLFYLLIYSHCSAEENILIGGCEKVKLVCENEDMIVVRVAAFLLGGDCDGEQLEDDVHNDDKLTRAVVEKCNGVSGKECLFDLKKDFSELEGWNIGRLNVTYSCVKNVYSYCGGKIEAKKNGIITSPGYPRYYLGGIDCVWKLVAKIGQTIKVTIVDLSLRENDYQCEDTITIQEDERTHHSTCEGLHSPLSMESETSELEIRMKTMESKQQIYLKRGFMLHYTTQGCAFPPRIADGVVVKLNNNQVQLKCNSNHLLMSTLKPSAILSCEPQTLSWTPPVEHCISQQWIQQYANTSIRKKLVEINMILSHKQK